MLGWCRRIDEPYLSFSFFRYYFVVVWGLCLARKIKNGKRCSILWDFSSCSIRSRALFFFKVEYHIITILIGGDCVTFNTGAVGQMCAFFFFKVILLNLMRDCYRRLRGTTVGFPQDPIAVSDVKNHDRSRWSH